MILPCVRPVTDPAIGSTQANKVRRFIYLNNDSFWECVMRMRYKIILKKTDEGYSVSCPGLPGCWLQGENEREALSNTKSAIEEYLGAIADSVKEQDIREVEVLFRHAETSGYQSFGSSSSLGEGWIPDRSSRQTHCYAER